MLQITHERVVVLNTYTWFPSQPMSENQERPIRCKKVVCTTAKATEKIIPDTI